MTNDTLLHCAVSQSGWLATRWWSRTSWKMAAFVSFHWLIPVRERDGKNPTPKPIGAKITVHHPSGSNLLVCFWLSVGIPVGDSPCHESPTRHYRFGHGPLTRSDSCENTGLSAEGIDEERVRCHFVYGGLRMYRIHTDCMEYVVLLHSTPYDMETSPLQLFRWFFLALSGPSEAQDGAILWHTPGTDTCHSDHWKEVAPSITIENPSNSSAPFIGWLSRELATMSGRTTRGYLSKWELALLLCAVISTGAGLVCNPVRPKREPGKGINFVPILSLRIMLLPISVWGVRLTSYSAVFLSRIRVGEFISLTSLHY